MTDAELEALLVKARARWDRMTPGEQAAEMAAQQESWVRAFAPCEHGMVDFEDCAKCRALAAQKET